MRSHQREALSVQCLQRILRPTLSDVEYCQWAAQAEPWRYPIFLERAHDEVTGLFVFAALHGVHQRNGAEQQASRALALASLPFDKQYYGVYSRDNASRYLIHAVRLGCGKREFVRPNRRSAACQIQQGEP